MKRTVTTLALSGLLIVSLGAVFWLRLPDWPEFSADSKEPQSVFNTGRDFAYHIGDLRQIDLFIHTPADLRLNIETLDLTGDFEISGRPRLASRTYGDGSQTYRLRISAQSFSAKSKLTVGAKCSFSGEKGVKEIDLQPAFIFTSNTWDGREELQEGEGMPWLTYWPWVKYGAPLAISLSVYLALTTLAVRAWYLRRKEVDPLLAIREELRAILQKVAIGEASAEEHLLLDGLVRGKFGIGPIPADSLELRDCRGIPMVREFLQLNAPAIYAEERPTAEVCAKLSQIATNLLLIRKRCA